jgi:starch synthase (maltosyl-transferring)
MAEERDTSDARLPADGTRRVFVDRVAPSVDGGRHPVKRVVGDTLEVEAVLVCDGHDRLAGVVHHRYEDEPTWRETALTAAGNDRYRASLPLPRLGRLLYQVEAWVDTFNSFREGLAKKVAAGLDVGLELRQAAQLLDAAARAASPPAALLLELARRLGDPDLASATRAALVLDPLLEVPAALDRRRAVSSAIHAAVIDPPLARSGAWYELFPRSLGKDGKHGTFRDVEEHLPYVAGMGFDVLYFPPIHPIGKTKRKGPNNSLTAGPTDPGSPWAIGAAEGGHTAIHPALGTLDDFRRLVTRARALELEIALDIVWQASPDHPWVREHPEWFSRRPDGSFQCAENPPKKYEDVYPFDFSTPAWRELWTALRDVILFWVQQGVTLFRVDNPHTKPLAFWAWCIDEVKRRHPETVFLAEAFTRPAMMHALAKLGFSQSYTYFTWRETKPELAGYLAELTSGEVAEFFRPNLWPNTPDILPAHLTWGTRATFLSRLVLAATLSPSYGIYGPAFELLDKTPRPGVEEYLDNEKYQLRRWNLDDPQSLRPVITRVNRIRKENPALLEDRNLTFHPTDDDAILAYSRRSRDGKNVVLVVVSLDAHLRRASHVHLDLGALGLQADERVQAHDQLGDGRWLWQGPRAYVELDPALPAQIFRLRRRDRTEHDFEYFL